MLGVFQADMEERGRHDKAVRDADTDAEKDAAKKAKFDASPFTGAYCQRGLQISNKVEMKYCTCVPQLLCMYTMRPLPPSH